MFIRKGVFSMRKKTTFWRYLLDVVLLFLVFITPFVSKLNHFGCLKLVSCLQFGLLFASIVSRFGYTMGICLPFVCFDGETKKAKKTDLSTSRETRVVGMSFCFFFLFVWFLWFWINPDSSRIQINPER